MDEVLRNLIALQGVDSEINQINLKKKTLPEELRKLDNEFASLRADVEKSRALLEETIKKHRELEEKLKKAGEALKKAKEKLLEVKTNKEYQAGLMEIEAMEKKNEEYEEAIILILDEIDGQKKTLKDKEEQLKIEGTKYEIRKKELMDELEALDEKLSSCLERKKELSSSLAPEIMKKYEQIRAINHGLAVVPAWREVCSGCHMNIPPQLYNELYAGDKLIYCPECHRILYWFDQSKDNV
ncbi:MAG: C4-type zinc ribbon domain-containing protein [Syntrophales bacterium]|nr:C4-type zinc ribbon domain-containing protein [Syntrophales bacterium]